VRRRHLTGYTGAKVASRENARVSYDAVVGLSDDARLLLAMLREMYVKKGHPNHKSWWFEPNEGDKQQERLFDELRAYGLLKHFGGHPRHGLTDYGLETILNDEMLPGILEAHRRREAGEDPVSSEGTRAKMPTPPDPKKVFVIHGRNMEARNQMGNFLRSLGLTARNFEDIRTSLGGSAKISDIIKVGMDEAQGVVALFTPDEFAALRPQWRNAKAPEEDAMRWQARPNVIFEAGMASGRDPDRVCFVLLGDVKLFTDVAGVHILRPTNSVVGDRTHLRNLLAQGMKCSVDPYATDWHHAGDFESCITSLDPVDPQDPFAVPEPRAESSAVQEELLDGMEAMVMLKSWIMKLSPRRAGERIVYANLDAELGLRAGSAATYLINVIAETGGSWEVQAATDKSVILGFNRFVGF